MTPARAAVLALAVACGCTDPLTNAILEVDLGLPPHLSASDTYAVVQVRAGEADFEPLWPDTDTAASFALVQDARTNPSLSVVAERELDFVSMKIRFCEDDRCARDPDGLSPEVHVLLEHPLYLGEYSKARVAVDEIPTAWQRITIDACQIEACTDEAVPPYCGEDGLHYCAAPP